MNVWETLSSLGGKDEKRQHGFQVIKMKAGDIFVRPRVPSVLEGK